MTTLTITAEQAELLRTHLSQAERARAELNLVFTAIVNGHGVTDARIVGLEGTTLTVAGPADD